MTGVSQYRTGGSTYGLHRVVVPLGVLPQSANKLDTSLPIYDNEILVSVNRLQLDAASFQQLKQETGGSGLVAQKILQIVRERGKMHNPVTNSGGVFLGKIEAIGPRHPLAGKLRVGDDVVSLVSLTLTPLVIEQIEEVGQHGQLQIKGHAILFESGMLTKIPVDLKRDVVMAALDVCGAPAQVKRRVKKGQKVLIVGLGKAGRSSAVQAERIGADLFGIDASEEAVRWCRKNLKGCFEKIDARDVLQLYQWVFQATGRELMDLVVGAASLPDCEMGSILACKPRGTVLFFGMNTSFGKATLGAEGIGADLELVMGNGYVPGHAELMLDLLRSHKPLREWFEGKFG